MGGASLAVGFFVQGAAFATAGDPDPGGCRTGMRVSDALLPAFLAAVPVLAGAGSVATEHLVRRVRAERGAALGAAGGVPGAAGWQAPASALWQTGGGARRVRDMASARWTRP